MNYPVIIGGSAGSFSIIFKMLPVLLVGFKFPIIICVHRLRTAPKGSYQNFLIHDPVPIREIQDKEPVLPGNVYIAPANKHLLFNNNKQFSLTDDPPIHYSRPSIDVCMNSAAENFGSKLIGILLTGANSDGASGMKSINDAGGVTLVQDPNDAEISVMPQAAIERFNPSYILSADKIIRFIENLASEEKMIL